MTTHRFLKAVVAGAILLGAGCASSPTAPISRERYARLNNERVYAADLPTVWKAVNRVTYDYKITDRDADGPKERSLRTDWIYTQSRDMHATTRIDGEVKDIPLESRIRFKIFAQTILGGTRVKVQSSEEIEQLGMDGSSKGYRSVSDSQRDSSRANELLDKIGLALISPAP